MKVSLDLEQPVGGRGAFTTLEYVRGVAKLDLRCRVTVSRIVLSLRGRIQIALKSKSPGEGAAAFGNVDRHKLFKISQNIFPPAPVPLASTGFTLPSGVHSFPFKIRFPVLSACHKPPPGITHLETTLPPSFRFDAPKHQGSAKVQYMLRVKVKRPGRFKHDPLTEQELAFLPLDPALPPPMFDPARSRSVLPPDFNAPLSNIRAAPTLRTQPNRSLLLEATLPSPTVLYVQGTVPLRLFVRTSATLTGEPPLIALRALRIAIKTKTTLTTGSDSATWTSSKDVVHISGQELQLIDSHASGESSEEVRRDFWKDATVPDMTQSFTTCTVRQQHWLVVIAGFSYSPGDAINVVEAVFCIEVHSGLPAVTEESDRYHGGGQTAAIPWRVGSGRHLGITRGSAIINDPPPLYG